MCNKGEYKIEDYLKDKMNQTKEALINARKHIIDNEKAIKKKYSKEYYIGLLTGLMQFEVELRRLKEKNK